MTEQDSTITQENSLKQEKVANQPTRSRTITEEFSQANDEKALLKKIAEHEVYSTAYKLKLAGIVAAKAAKIAGKGAVIVGKGAVVLGKQALKGSQTLAKKISDNQEKKRKNW